MTDDDKTTPIWQLRKRAEIAEQALAAINELLEKASPDLLNLRQERDKAVADVADLRLYASTLDEVAKMALKEQEEAEMSLLALAKSVLNATEEVGAWGENDEPTCVCDLCGGTGPDGKPDECKHYPSCVGFMAREILGEERSADRGTDTT